MSDIVFIIEKSWWNTMAGHFDKSYGYSLIGFVDDEEKARRICDEGRVYTKKDFPVFTLEEEVPELRYKPLEKYKEA